MVEYSNQENREFEQRPEDAPQYETPPRPAVYTPTKPPTNLRQGLFFKIGGIGMLVWGIVLFIYELYQWWVGQFGLIPGMSYVEGLALISFMIGIGATLTSIAGLGFQQTLYHSPLPRFAFLLSLIFGWLFFVSDMLDLIAPGLGVLLWSLTYVLTGVLLIIWSRVMSQLSAFRPNDFAKYSGYLLIIGGIVYLAAPLIFIYFTMFIAPLGLVLAAFATLGTQTTQRRDTKESDYERELL